jgi:hypothetical protein
MAEARSVQAEFEAYVARQARSPQRRTSGLPERALVWLALAPSWPGPLTAEGFPGDSPDGLLQGSAAREVLDRIVAARLARFRRAELPREDDVYWMEDAERSLVLRELAQSRDNAESFFLSELHQAAAALGDAASRLGKPLAPLLKRWVDLAGQPGGPEAMAGELDRAVNDCLEDARKAGAVVAPAVRSWITTAAPLAEAFGGTLAAAVARAGRRLELFQHRSRDEQFLRNYQPRHEPEEALRNLIFDGRDDAWALHYVGDGGMGKTMLIRRIKTQLATASDWGLAVAGVDFDMLHRDYPSRAPGLLLMGLAEELRLVDDPKVEEAFRAFDGAIATVHKRLEGLASDPRLRLEPQPALPERPMALFIEALRLLAKATGHRILLILDTCEELARIRIDGTLPGNVAATFDVLERIHKEFKPVRVVFAGRRPLASSGFGGWTWRGCRLKEREWLRLHVIEGFTRNEALAYLERYRQQDRPVPPDLRPLILSLSIASDENSTSPVEFAREDTPSPSPQYDRTRYNPYDLDMFAVLASSDPPPDPVKLRAAPRSFYVRERILGKVSPLIRELLPYVAALGSFDKELVRDLRGAQDGRFDTIFGELTDQEWIDSVPNRRRSGPVWAVDHILRSRLVEYYATDERSAARAARNRVAGVMPDLLLRRPWADLIPEYFQAALVALAEQPARAREWWARVEARLVSEGQWEWAKELPELLLAEEDPDRPEETAADPETDLLRGEILATQAVAALHLDLREQRAEIWSKVLAIAERHPGTEGAARLAQRSRAGRMAAREWAATPGLALVQMEDWLASEPKPEPERLDAALAVAELARIENVVELLELGRGTALNDPDDFAWPDFEAFKSSHARLRESIEKRARSMERADHLAGPARAFLGALIGRLARVRGAHDEAASRLSDAIGQARSAPASSPLADWRAPDDLAARLGLEFIRALYAVHRGPAELLRHPALAAARQHMAFPTNIDRDRLASAFLVLEGFSGLPSRVPNEVIAASREVRQSPRCLAHREIPPLFVAACEALAARGAVESAVQSLTQSLKVLPPHLRLEAERGLLRIAIRMRLLDLRVGWSTNLLPRLADQKLLLDARAFGLPRDSTAIAEQNAQLPVEWPPGGLPGAALDRLLLKHLAWRALGGRLDRPPAIEPAAGEMRPYVLLSLLLDWMEWQQVRRDQPWYTRWAYFLVYLMTRRSKRDWIRRQMTSLGVNPVRSFCLALRATSLGIGSGLSDELDEMASRIGVRRAAEIALDEGWLAGSRGPDIAHLLLFVAHTWFGRTADAVGAFLASVGASLMPVGTRHRVFGRVTAEAASRHFEACVASRPDLRGLGPPSENAANALLSLATLDEGWEAKFTWWGWQPWCLRWYCGWAGPAGYWFPRSLERVPELFEQQRMQDIPPDLTNALRGVWLRRAVRRALLVLGQSISLIAALAFVGGMISFLGSAVIWLGARLHSTEYTGVNPLFFLAGAVGCLIVFGLVNEFVERHSKRDRAGPAETPNPAAPAETPIGAVSQSGTNPIEIELAGPLPASVKVQEGEPLCVRAASRAPAAPASYASETVSSETYRARSRHLYEGGFVLRPTPKPGAPATPSATERRDILILLEDQAAGREPWEAMIALGGGAPDVDPMTDLRFVRRLAGHSVRGPTLPFPGPMGIVTWTQDVQALSWSQVGWSALTRGKLFTHQVVSGPRPSEADGGRAGLLHVVGTIREIYGILAIELGGRTVHPEKAVAFNRVTPEELAGFFPDLRVCVLQDAPSEDPRRSMADRDTAASWRLMAAALVRLGVPSVVIIPAVPQTAGVEAIICLADMLDKASQAVGGGGFEKVAKAAVEIWRTLREGPSSGPLFPTLKWIRDKYRYPHRTGPWILAGAVCEVRKVIVRRIKSDREAAREIAYDACVYAADELSLEVAAPEREPGERPKPPRAATS